jgi:DNA primase
MLEDLSYIDCEDLLNSVGIKNVSKSAGEINFSCPSADHFHGDRSPSARMNSRTTAWMCHSCSKSGNAITFLAWHKTLPETVARRLLEERYGGGSISIGINNLEQEVLRYMKPEIVEEEKRISPDESWLDNFKVNWGGRSYTGLSKPSVYMEKERGFSSEILRKWEIGYDDLSERITIPIRDHEGNLAGFKGRSWRENTIPKYMILGDNRNQSRYGFQPYQKSKYIFGLDKIELNSDLTVVIVEGELNVIAMDQHGFQAIGIAGSEFSQTQCDLINETKCYNAILFLDSDKAGNKGTKKVVEMLSPYMPLKIIQNAPGDAAELDTENVKELISSAKSALELQVEGKL